MAGNTFGEIFKITTFGESHGPALGVIIDGCPSGLSIDLDFIQDKLNKRRPGQSDLSSTRKEDDRFNILSGVFEGKSTGTPICITIDNKDSKSSDYDKLKDVLRPGHADYTYLTKYGIRDYRGGGRSSARETVARVAAGAIAQLFLQLQGIQIISCVSSIGHIGITTEKLTADNMLTAYNYDTRCPDADVDSLMKKYITQLKDQGDSTGGTITTLILNCPAGLGEPVFDKINADLAKAVFSINAVKGFEIGDGMGMSKSTGSIMNDAFTSNGNSITTTSNHNGGILGGITNGMEIRLKTAFKPVSTIMQNQSTVNTFNQPVTILASGRHDPVVVPRAIPIVDAMVALVIADHLLRNRSAKV
ncbi:MAG: chorismate synthase [Bacteroidota bacterium]|nr:chorismate synthase [Bacteroidota bacterium]